MSKLRLMGIGILLGLVGGFFVTQWIIKTPAAQIITGPTSTGVTQVLLDLISKRDKELQRVNDSTRTLLGASKRAYDDSLAAAHKKFTQDSIALAHATTPGDSLAKCSLLVLDCQARAELAEGRVRSLTTQLTRQIAQQPHRCGLDVGPGIGIGVKPFAVRLEPIQVGAHCRIFF